ncbi:MAG: hemolysin family protein [Calditrichaceae bacterium]
MDPSSSFYILVFLLLLVMSAFFSGSETAYFSLTKSTIAKLSHSKHAMSRQVSQLLKEPKKLLIAIIIGNTVVNVATASLAAILATGLIAKYSLNKMLVLMINVFLVTIVILFFSEILPKVTAIKSSKKIAIKFAYPLTFFYYLFYPVTILFDFLTHGLSRFLSIDKDKFSLTEDELRTLVDVGAEKGALQKDEKEMIHSIFEMGDTIVREIMVPRMDMICLEKGASLFQVLKVVKDKLHSRIPIYSDTVDNIVGILFVKDLLPLIKRKTIDDFDLAKLAHPPYYVPEQKKINELLREFQAEKIHMALVVDEYGGTSGLVTLEDVIEEIVGEIQDEYDREKPLYNVINDNTFVVNGSMQLEEINDVLDLDLPTEEDFETLAGFLLSQFGSVPKVKEKTSWNGYEFTVEKVYRRRIELVKIIKKIEEVKQINKP